LSPPALVITRTFPARQLGQGAAHEIDEVGGVAGLRF
jgi:hypothetical protein